MGTRREKRGAPDRRSDVQRLKPAFEYIAELQAHFRISCADRADIIIRKILEFRAGFYTITRFPAFLVIDIIAHGTEITGGPPFLKTPLPDPSFSLHSADRTEIVVGEVLKGRAGWDAMVGFAPEG